MGFFDGLPHRTTIYPYGSHRIAYNRTEHAPATIALETPKSLSNARFSALLHVYLVNPHACNPANPFKWAKPSTQRTQHWEKLGAPGRTRANPAKRTNA